MNQPKIFGFRPSTYTQTACMVADEVGVAVEPTPVEFHQPSHFARHPFGKMPILEHGEIRLYETLAIVDYFDRTWGEHKLRPESPLEHARMLQWCSIAVDYAYPALVAGLHNDAPSAEAVSLAAERLKLLDTELGESSYLSGSTVTLADFMLLPMVSFARAKLQADAVPGLPKLEAWHVRMLERPSVRRWSTYDS